MHQKSKPNDEVLMDSSQRLTQKTCGQKVKEVPGQWTRVGREGGPWSFR